MTHTPRDQAEIIQDRYGLRLAARLSAGAAELPHDISERLRVARQQAVSRRKVAAVRLRTASSVSLSDHGASLTFDHEKIGLWGRLAGALPLLGLAAGLVTIHLLLNDERASEVAEVDTALLTDDLPPSAYTDPGFLQYLKTAGSMPASR